jgi:GNAT superfamily N-acetyltransferase
MLAEEAVQVSQLMYRAYGNTYFNPDVYYPDRVAAQNAHGAILSFVARAADGTIAGHYALELNQEGPVAETGQAVVDPEHRGRGLLKMMQGAALEEARRRELIGWYGDAVAVHTLTQKSNVSSGGHLCAVDLGISPAGEVFRGIGGQQSQRVTCLMYFHWLSPPKARTVHVPERHVAITETIYANLQCPIRLGAASPAVGHGVLAVKMQAAAARGNIRAELLGADTFSEIRHAKRDLVERSGAQVVFVDLPLEDPATPALVEALETEGLAFAGIAPEFSSRGDLLRLVYLVEPLQREPIKTLEPLGDQLVNYCLAEQARVRAE